MLIAIAAIAVLAAVFGLLLGYSAIRFHIDGDPIADQVDALLPQSQCGQCGYPGCRPYAEAVAAGEADINLCSPGGRAQCWLWPIYSAGSRRRLANWPKRLSASR